jgi:hypothetical protein
MVAQASDAAAGSAENSVESVAMRTITRTINEDPAGCIDAVYQSAADEARTRNSQHRQTNANRERYWSWGEGRFFG